MFHIPNLSNNISPPVIRTRFPGSRDSVIAGPDAKHKLQNLEWIAVNDNKKMISPSPLRFLAQKASGLVRALLKMSTHPSPRKVAIIATEPPPVRMQVWKKRRPF